MSLQRVRLAIEPEIVQRLDRLAHRIGCCRNLVMCALLDGASAIVEIDRVENLRQKRLVGIEEPGPACLLSFAGRVTAAIPHSRRSYAIVQRTLF